MTRKKGYKQIELTSYGEDFIPIAERWIYLWQEMQCLREDRENLYLTIGCTDTINSAMMFNLYSGMLDEDEQITNFGLKPIIHQKYIIIWKIMILILVLCTIIFILKILSRNRY